MIYRAILALVICLLSTNAMLCQKPVGSKINHIDTSRIYPSYLLDELPKFKGGKDSLSLLFAQIILNPASRFDYEGVVLLCLTISSKGELLNINIFGEPASVLFESYALKLKDKIHNWEPGKISKKSVKSMICLPVIIKIE